MQSSPLRHELADDQRCIRKTDDKDRQSDRFAVLPGECERPLADHHAQVVDDLLAAISRTESADQRDPDLHRGQETVGILR